MHEKNWTGASESTENPEAEFCQGILQGWTVLQWASLLALFPPLVVIGPIDASL